MKVALFVTCLADGLIPEVAKATVRVLERLGVTVDMPIGQTCCGQIHLNTGYPREALPLVRNHVAAFEPYDAIVAPSGSCTAAIQHQHADLARLAGNLPLAAVAAAVAARTWELSEFLVDMLGVTDVGAYFPHRVTYHPTCHSLRSSHGSHSEPRRATVRISLASRGRGLLPNSVRGMAEAWLKRRHVPGVPSGSVCSRGRGFSGVAAAS